MAKLALFPHCPQDHTAKSWCRPCLRQFNLKAVVVIDMVTF